MREALVRLSPYLAGFFFITTIMFSFLAVYRGDVISAVKDSIAKIEASEAENYPECRHSKQIDAIATVVSAEQGSDK